MITYKEIHTILNLVDPEDIYNPDKNNLYKKLLTEKYAGRNYQGCHILEITKIIKSSNRQANKTLEGGCSASVHFEARVLEASKGDILTNCTVVNINSKTELFAKTDIAGVKVVCLDTGIYKVGDVIPCIIGSMQFNVGQSEISFVTSQFSPSFSDTIYYKINEPFKKEDEIKNKFILDSINKLESQKLKSDDKKIYEFFKELIYPFKKEKKINGIKKWESIKSLKVNDIVSIPDELNKYRKGFILGAKKVETISISAGNFYSIFLIDYYKYLSTLDSLTTSYSLSDIKKYKLMWKTYNMLKK